MNIAVTLAGLGQGFIYVVVSIFFIWLVKKVDDWRTKEFDDDVECSYVLKDSIAKTNPIPHGTEGHCPEPDMTVYCKGGCPADRPKYRTEYTDCEGQNKHK